MSIILKALEKAEKEKQTETLPVSQSRPVDRQDTIPEKKEADSEIKILSIDSRVSSLPKKIEAVPKIIKPNYPRRILISALLIAIITLSIINLSDIKFTESIESSLPVPTPSFPKVTFSIDTPPDEQPPVEITGVVWDELDPIVIVNGKFLKKGEEISGAKILDIRLNEVKVLYKDKESTISIQ